MASAPRPGAGKRQVANDQAQKLARITIKGETHTLAIGSIPLREKIAVRKACGGLPFEAFWSGDEKIGEDSLMIMWWLAKRANGTPDMQLSEIEDTWPDDLVEGDIEFEIDDPDDEDDSPEASGPGSSTPGPPSDITSV